jgi:hypothetical protein
MWAVQLLGDQVDLAALAESFGDGTVKIFRDGDDYLLSSEQFLGSDDANAVFAKASALAAVVSGGLRLAFNALRPIQLGNVCRIEENGKRHRYLMAEPGTIHCRIMPVTLTLKLSDGIETQWRPADLIKSWSEVATGDEAVSHVLQAFSIQTSWVGLYGVLDTIAKDVGGWDKLPSRGWIASEAMRLFKHTANSYEAVGLESRHGVGKVVAPTHPMNLAEARSLVETVVHAWLGYKAGGAGLA